MPWLRKAARSFWGIMTMRGPQPNQQKLDRAGITPAAMPDRLSSVRPAMAPTGQATVLSGKTRIEPWCTAPVTRNLSVARNSSR